MVTLDVRADVKPAVDYLNRIAKGVGDKAIVAALNETMKQVKTQMSRRIRDEYNIDVTTVREKLVLKQASRKGQNFTAILVGNPAGRSRRSLNVIRFLRAGATKAATRRAKNNLRADLRFRIKKSGGDKAIKGSFILNVPGSPVFERKNGKLVAVRTLGVPSMFQAKKVQVPVQRWIDANFPRIFRARMDYFLSTVK
jgi:Prophage minor tail protein Z (GPZ)